MRTLATPAPQVLTTSLSAAMAWYSQEGITTQWTAIGEGCVDLRSFFKLFAELYPGVPEHAETGSGLPRRFPIYTAVFKRQFLNARVEGLAAFPAVM